MPEPIEQSVRAYDNLELLARQLVEGFITGLHKSPYHGFSVEFAEHKAYNPGESLRYMDWKLFARTDRLYTRRYEEETNLRCCLVVDQSPSMYYPEPGRDKIRFATLASACLAWMLHRQRDAVGLVTFDERLQEQTRMRSTSAHVQGLFAILERVASAPIPKTGGTQVADTLHTLAETLGQRCLVAIFSDVLQPGHEEEIFAALQHLRHRKHEVILFHTRHAATELELDVPNRSTLFVDAETGERLRANPYTLREAYRREVAAFYHRIKLRCAQNRIDLVEANVEDGVNPILQAYLVKRSKMR